MDLRFLTRRTRSTAVADFLAAKLQSEIGPYSLSRTLERDPDSVLVVDVRDRDAFEQEHIRCAVNVPAETIIAGLARMPKSRLIVTCCWDASCALAAKAALDLAQKGYKVRYLLGGVEGWKRKGFPVERPVHGERQV